MKAYVLHGIGNISYEQVPEPMCQPGWALVRVKAAGICSSDIPRIFEKGTYHFPTIPGHEISGIVERVGDLADKAWEGKRVGVFPLIPCKKCSQCDKGNYELCDNYDYVGSRRDGGFAELVSVPVWNLVELAPGIFFEEAAMMEPLAVALHAIKRGNIHPGDSVGIIGTGMIGFAAAQWAKKFGASKVYIVGRTEDKRVLCHNIDSIEYLLESEKLPLFDLTVEAVGSNSALISAINNTIAGGRIVLMGNPSGDIQLPQNIYWRILRKQLSLTGTWNSSYAGVDRSDWVEVGETLAQGSISAKALISHRFLQNELIQAFMMMYERKEPYCKVMTFWN